MRDFWAALQAELIKNRRARIKLVTLAAFSLAPLFGGIFMYLMLSGGYSGLSGAFKAKALLFNFEANWASFLNLLVQAMVVGGLILFGFTASWLFGREYSEHTAKDLLALPISRVTILQSKFIYLLIWCFVLAFWLQALGLVIGLALHLPGWSWTLFFGVLKMYLWVTLMVWALNLPTALFAMVSRGYLAPLGAVILAVVFAQILGVLGLGHYFPWAIPAQYSGSVRTSDSNFRYTVARNRCRFARFFYSLPNTCYLILDKVRSKK